MGIHTGRPSGDRDEYGGPEPGDRAPGEAPETPPDEPQPIPIQDPRTPADPQGPYTVTGARVGRYMEDGTVNNTERKERRGFASMSAEKQREIASKGGRAAHEKGTAHEWTADEARSAGRKGGQVSRGGRGRLMETLEAPAANGPEIVSFPDRLDANRPE
jgi:uncharacterized protein